MEFLLIDRPFPGFQVRFLPHPGAHDEAGVEVLNGRRLGTLAFTLAAVGGH